jgi:chromosome segregation protein
LHFAKLKLTGFKSFVEPTEFVIQPGLTGLVGPNGCGKSNLVEALRWVMGETSAKQMRGGGMDDVIFSGNDQRPARNFAEVVLRLENPTRDAPAAFNDADEIEVTRRIERDEGSQYRVNGRDVRARDVQLFFADAATGPRSPAIVSQGKVGALINAKPIERRAILEEAAGIAGLHSRRHEAELRLAAAEQNLARVADVIAQLEAQLASLERQARQAARYRKLAGDIRKTEALKFHLLVAEAERAIAAAAERLGETERAVALRDEEAVMAGTAQAEAAAALPPLRQAEAEAGAALHRLIVARDGLDAEAARIAREQEETTARRDQTERDRGRAEGQAGDAQGALARLDDEARALVSAQAGEEEILRATAAAAEARRADVQAGEGQTQQATEALAAETARRQSLGRDIDEATSRLARLAARAHQLVGEKATLALNAQHTAEVEEQARRIETLRAAQETAREAQVVAEAGRRAATATEQAAREASLAAESQAARLRAEQRALAAVLAPGQQGLWPAILDALTVEPGYEAALGAAFGDDLNVPAEDSAPVHWRALDAYADAPPLPEGATALSTFVRAPAALARRLAQIGVVDGDGMALQAALRPGQALVDRNGALWRWDGLTAKAGAPTAAAERLAQRNRLRDIETSLGAAEAEANDKKAAHQAARLAQGEAGAADDAARQAQRQAERALIDAEQAQARAIEKAAAESARMAAIEDALRSVDLDTTDTATKKARAEAELAALPPVGDARGTLETLRAQLAEAREALAQARGDNERALREAAGRAQRLRAIESERASWLQRADALAVHLAELVERRAEIETRLAALAAQPGEIAARRSALELEIGGAEDRRRAAAAAVAEAEDRQAGADRAAKAANAALAEAREARVRAEGQVAQCGAARSELDQRIAEALDCTAADLAGLAEIGAADAPRDRAEIEAKLDRLKRSREAIGPVNLRAEEEAAEIAERHKAMHAEKTDLESAIAKLRHGIGDLNREGRSRLMDAFGHVDRHFRELFTQLFGGGSAHLALVESDDPLEAGLEIMASPPGKRLQVMSLLSGGEQALTAVALLFAVFLTNPAPICILDEVDAPLDDANVERVCNLLDEMAAKNQTRFLVVTHHPLTMARMDRLYGVTMAERGVSSLVSVDLRRAEELRATA